VPRLDAIGIVASDLAASIAFYRLLGLEFPADGDGHVEATAPGGLRVMLDTEETIRSFDPDWSPPAGGGHRSSLAFLCDSPSDVDETYQRLVDAGASPHKAPWDAFWGQRYAEVKDPDGNVVDLFAPLETSTAA
jgi:catechol 2,3-dioxygenase-like lactoylglutathione lyase family enzyme